MSKENAKSININDRCAGKLECLRDGYLTKCLRTINILKAESENKSVMPSGVTDKAVKKKNTTEHLSS